MNGALPHIALLRGVNVGGHNKIPMADLRGLAAGLGWKQARTYIQSGNLVFTATGEIADLELRLEQAIELRFKWTVPVIVRSAAVWSACAGGNPFSDAAANEPNRVMLALSKHPAHPGAAGELQGRASNGERVALVGGVMWIHFPQGAGGSKLTPCLLDRIVGSPVTMRNIRTVLELREMAEQTGLSLTRP
jgi:uncharacterized protein (DUF1697 family)